MAKTLTLSEVLKSLREKGERPRQGLTAKAAELNLSAELDLYFSTKSDEVADLVLKYLAAEFEKIKYSDEGIDANCIEKDDDEEDVESSADDETEEECANKKSAPVGFTPSRSAFVEAVKSAGFQHAYNEASDSFLITRSIGNAILPDTAKDFTKAAETEARNDFTPTADEFAKILSFTKRKDYSPKDFKVYQTISAGSDVDKHNEHFSYKALRRMGEYSPGAPVMQDHDYRTSAKVIGQIFEGAVKKTDGKAYLVQKFYVENSPENQAAIRGFENGSNAKLSVGVSVRRKDYLCDCCKKPMFKAWNLATSWEDYWCGHMAGMELDEKGTISTATISDVAAFNELSRVTVPAQPCAQIKSMSDAVKSYQTAGFKFQESAKGLANYANNLPNSDKSKVNTENNSASEIPTEKSPSLTKLFTFIKGDSAVDENQFSELFKGLVESVQKQTESIVKQNELLEKQNSLLEKSLSSADEISKAAAELEKANKEKSELFEKQVAETREVVAGITAAHKHLAETCGMLSDKSVQELGAQIARHIPRDKTSAQAAEDARTKSGADGQNFYNGFSNQFSVGLTLPPAETGK